MEVLELLAQDAFDPLLKTHKLQGQLEGLWSCWVEYEWNPARVSFKAVSIEVDSEARPGYT